MYFLYKNLWFLLGCGGFCQGCSGFCRVAVVLRSNSVLFLNDEVFHAGVPRFFPRDGYPFFSGGAFFISVSC